MKNILLIILFIILIILIVVLINSEKITYQENFIDNKYNCEETLKLQDDYYSTPNDINLCNEKLNIISYDNYDNIDLSTITNQITDISDNYFKINYYNSKDLNNNLIKVASIKSYLGLPGYLPSNFSDNPGDLSNFKNNYNINNDLTLKVVSQAYNYVYNNNYN